MSTSAVFLDIEKTFVTIWLLGFLCKSSKSKFSERYWRECQNFSQRDFWFEELKQRRPWLKKNSQTH
jgi:hypothetical protein